MNIYLITRMKNLEYFWLTIWITCKYTVSLMNLHTYRILAWLYRKSKRLEWTRTRLRSTTCKISGTSWKVSSRYDRGNWSAKNSAGRTKLNSWIPFYGWTISNTWTSPARCTMYYKSRRYNAEKNLINYHIIPSSVSLFTLIHPFGKTKI